MTWLFVGIFLMAVGVFTMPIDLLPNTRAASGRALLGAFLLIVAGMVLGQMFVCGSP